MLILGFGGDQMGKMSHITYFLGAEDQGINKRNTCVFVLDSRF